MSLELPSMHHNRLSVSSDGDLLLTTHALQCGRGRDGSGEGDGGRRMR